MLKKTIILLMTVQFIITACGHSNDNSSTASPNSSTSATVSDKATSATSKLSIVGKNGSSLALAGDSSVDGMFFGSFNFSAISYDKQSKQVTIYTIGISKPSIDYDGKGIASNPKCQTDLLKPNETVAINFCGTDNEAKANTFSTHYYPYSISSELPADMLDMETNRAKDQAAADAYQANMEAQNAALTVDRWTPTNNTFSVDFLITNLRSLGVVKEGTAYVEGGNTRVWSLYNNLSVKDLTQQKVANAESNVKIIYARKDWFPTAFSITLKSSIGYSNESPVASTSIDLSDDQKVIVDNILRFAGLGKGTDDMMTSIAENKGVIISVVPMDQQTLDTTGYQAPAAPSTTTDTNSTTTASTSSTAPTTATTNANAVTPSVSTSTSLSLADTTTIPLAQAKFVMSVDFSAVLSSDSVLHGDASTFEFNRTNGVPFGTSVSVKGN
jgi:hypothetical protein